MTRSCAQARPTAAPTRRRVTTAAGFRTSLEAVTRPGEPVTAQGLVFAATPATDFIRGTLQLAAGMNMHVFTTGEGTIEDVGRQIFDMILAAASGRWRTWAGRWGLDNGIAWFNPGPVT